ncbi:fumarylacetoacetate hydrolase family protein [Ammoniphilus sp. CFH 90114]|uniref:fumarylacetoacetate hydrolase family protein n=1 Tax=Ammoniphilus sp. CFH 90114 TaxID=2493665 RepID=UPI00100E9FC3|nr:fumarylacetoacetate hydrolase family protein [Ammoniphilus sp. CFH 90114]RXT02290.1 FAA hydrolase family protein [Ammoniphilus sp. CFH 90114]
MITVTFKEGQKWKLGLKTDKGILDVEQRMVQLGVNGPITVQEWIEKGDSIQEIVDLLLSAEDQELEFLDESTLEWGPCVTEPQKIICVGLNYRRHAEESKMAIPAQPILFSKYNNALNGHLGDIYIPDGAMQLDYEAELAIIIGKEAKMVEKEDALSYVYGYATANDVSARDWQMKSSQWLLGKTSDGFCPIGPYLVSKDEIPKPNNLKIQTTLNGQVRQNSNTSDMIFYCDEIVSYISKHFTLQPGDVILTGTPEGVILGYEESEREWLKEGDEVSIEIEGLGRLTNTVRDLKES